MEIALEQNIYSCLPEKNTLYILPMRFTGIKRYAYIKQLKDEFSRDMIEAVYQIKSSTAKGWIKQWMGEGAITSEGKGKNVRYLFK